MPLRRTPPPAPASLAAQPAVIHCKSDSNINMQCATISVPTVSREHASSEPNIAARKRKRKEDVTKEEILEMFAVLKNEQEEKFNMLLTKVQSGIDTLTQQNTHISSSIDFLSQKYDEMVSRVNTLEKEKLADHKYIKSLEARVEQVERTLRSTTIEVRNVPKKPSETKEDLISIVKGVGNALGVPIQTPEVRDVYRINTKKENQPIVAEFSSVYTRDKIVGSVKAYNKKYPTNKFNTTNLKLEGPQKPIFVSEGLTVQTKKVFYLAREFAKCNAYKYCWTARGRIYLRRSDGAQLVKINEESDLERLKNIKA